MAAEQLVKINKLPVV